MAAWRAGIRLRIRSLDPLGNPRQELAAACAKSTLGTSIRLSNKGKRFGSSYSKIDLWMRQRETAQKARRLALLTTPELPSGLHCGVDDHHLVPLRGNALEALLPRP